MEAEADHSDFEDDPPPPHIDDDDLDIGDLPPSTPPLLPIPASCATHLFGFPSFETINASCLDSLKASLLRTKATVVFAQEVRIGGPTGETF